MHQFMYLALLILSLVFTCETACYFPDGKTKPLQDTPCHSEGESTCCGQGYACLSNNLCMLTEHVANPVDGQSTWVRGSCTDNTWKSPNCPNVCLTFESGGIGLNKCAVREDRYYCIDGDTEGMQSTDICASSTYFVQFAGTPSTVTIIGASMTPSSTMSSESSNARSSTSSVSSVVITSSTSTPAPPPELQHGNKDYSITIGVGVGVPLGVIAIILATLLYFRHRQSIKQRDGDIQTAAVNPHQSHVQKDHELAADTHVHSSPQNPPQAVYYNQPEWLHLVEMPADNNRR